MQELVRSVLSRAEAAAQSGNYDQVFRNLRDLTSHDYCNLLMKIPGEYPHLAQTLPILPSDQDQRNWTGNSGRELMVKSEAVARLLNILFMRATGRRLEGARILDYGCGWGRLIRQMYRLTDPSLVFGIDPMERSLAACRSTRITQNLALCDAVPDDLPFPDETFDLIFSYSVLTHTSERATKAMLRAARRRIASGGVFIPTIRPVGWWDLRTGVLTEAELDGLRLDHQTKGFAYYCPRAIDGRLGDEYGDTSMSLAWLKEAAAETGWRVVELDHDLAEPWQIMVVLAPE